MICSLDILLSKTSRCLISIIKLTYVLIYRVASYLKCIFLICDNCCKKIILKINEELLNCLSNGLGVGLKLLENLAFTPIRRKLFFPLRRPPLPPRLPVMALFASSSRLGRGTVTRLSVAGVVSGGGGVVLS